MYGTQNVKPLEITFDWLFDRIRQEDVYLKYFGFCDLNSKYCNPLRQDSKPDCSFYWYNGILFFKDFALNKAYTCISVVMQVERLTYTKALHKIYSVFLENTNISEITKIDRVKKSKEYKDIKVKIQPFTQQDIDYLKSHGITSDLCVKYHVYSIKHYWINGEMLYNYNNYNPCIGYYFNGKWKLYNYKADNYRFISNTSHEELQGYDQLDWIGDVCIITKSMKDLMLYRRFDINAVAPHSESLSNWKDKIDVLRKRFKRVIINFDNDRAGKEATDKVLKEFDLEVFYIPDEKDISDYYKKFGFEKTKQLVEQLK